VMPQAVAARCSRSTRQWLSRRLPSMAFFAVWIAVWSAGDGHVRLLCSLQCLDEQLCRVPRGETAARHSIRIECNDLEQFIVAFDFLLKLFCRIRQ
jgi:hypothetical protein